ncbi:MAG: class II fructose-bisphosphate aldolase [Treponema sp.]|nr:class II fructose-bisphosphate aldolase [Treponema sp.]
MPAANAREILLKATKEQYAVGAFNVTSLVQMEAVVHAAAAQKAPVIIQTSVSPAQFLRPEVLAAAYRVLADSSPYPVCLHLDHCTDVDFCKRCADAGYTNIMIDASKEVFEENVRKTKEVAEYCHSRGDITVEGELGTVVGVEDNVSVQDREVALCDTDKAEEFVLKTGIDLFAPAIGTAHGLYKSAPKIDFELLKKTARLINGTAIRAPLVIHGGTGLSEDVTRTLVSLGGAKFNVSTELKHVLIDASYEYLAAKRGDYNPGKLDAAVFDKTAALISRWIAILGSAGRY